MALSTKGPQHTFFCCQFKFCRNLRAFKNAFGEISTKGIMLSEKFQREASGFRRDFIKCLENLHTFVLSRKFTNTTYCRFWEFLVLPERLPTFATLFMPCCAVRCISLSLLSNITAVARKGKVITRRCVFPLESRRRETL